ncbi:MULTISPECIES: hypothetical protein [Xanthocytophaga]|uniref:Uncharacterized protein n=2 Tax=Xanthocytophaga TaxID=3078918 RepID=A0AAE3QY60_9BACT|nr:MULTISPECIES: hypothetical protein [Xanthocytophaga]MDJ1485335.1 hypothetical protein [Xanthocytophaga flavus]MDJ1505048.1 hypothetical protein [Xanthocytophaga agilis]
MQNQRDKGDYGITPTDEEKERLSGKDQSGPTALNNDKKQNGTDEEEGTERDSDNTEERNKDASKKVHTPYQEGGR